MTTPPLYLGCPVWSERRWLGTFFTAAARPHEHLAQYASVFDAVEGNSTFYGLPRAETVQRWAADAPARFRFCFKFPQRISHALALRGAEADTAAFLARLAPLGACLGPCLLQLPASFGPDGVPALLAYLDALPAGYTCVVEVRHPAFFAKGEAEIALNRALRARGVDRAILDSRALFSTPPPDAASAEAQARKPRLPVHAVAVGPRPLLRFIGHPELERNRAYLAPWVDRLAAWIGEGRTPYVFTHMPDNRDAPALARLFHGLLRARLPELPPLPPAPAARTPRQRQADLF